MATIQRGNTKVANKLISYAEKRAEVREGVNCPSEYAKAQFKATRELWNKNDGIQAHHVIQSFKPGEVTPDQANEIGCELAKKIAKGHECVVYTHTDKEHIHNHIVINSVSYENGSKYHSHGKEGIYQIREASDELCQERGLSVIKEHEKAPLRYTLAEKSLIEKGESSWKDEIRDKIDYEKQHATSFIEFKENMFEKHGIEVKERGKNTTYINHENGKRVRGNKLGEAYEKETIKGEYQKHEREQGQERGTSRVSNEQQSRIVDETESNRGLSISPSEREHAKGSSDQERTRTDSSSEQETTRTNDFDINEFNKKLAERQRELQEGYYRQYRNTHESDRSTEQRNEKQQPKSERGIDKQQSNDREEIDRDREQQQKHNERVREQDHEHDLER